MRAFFRLHLATVVVLMLVAGVLVGLNVRGARLQEDRYGWEVREITFVSGWPILAKHVTWHFVWKLDGEHYANPIIGKWDWKYAIPVNVAVALAILVVTAFVCELFMRRARPAGTVAARPN